MLITINYEPFYPSCCSGKQFAFPNSLLLNKSFLKIYFIFTVATSEHILFRSRSFNQTHRRHNTLCQLAFAFGNFHITRIHSFRRITHRSVIISIDLTQKDQFICPLSLKRMENFQDWFLKLKKKHKQKYQNYRHLFHPSLL